MKWSTEKPKEAGYYWIYTIPEWEDDSVVMIVYVNIFDGEISFDIPCDGYECERQITPKRTTHYMGIVQEPAPPGKA
jgi:hypothetical protein